MKHYTRFLRTLETMSNFGMIKACRDAGLEQIGKGSSRLVFAINDKLVIKIANCPAGVGQNKTEVRINYMLEYDFPGWKKYFAKIHNNLCHPRDTFIVMERLDTNFDGKRTVCTQYNNVRYRPTKVTDRRVQLHVKAVQFIDALVMSSNARDIHAKNLGISANGCIKLLDFGLSNSTLRQYYNRFERKVKRELIPA